MGLTPTTSLVVGFRISRTDLLREVSRHSGCKAHGAHDGDFCSKCGRPAKMIVVEEPIGALFSADELRAAMDNGSRLTIVCDGCEVRILNVRALCNGDVEPCWAIGVVIHEFNHYGYPVEVPMTAGMPFTRAAFYGAALRQAAARLELPQPTDAEIAVFAVMCMS